MNTLQLIQVIEQDPKSKNKFCGVYPSDILPVIQHYPCGIICNTDPHTEKGSHWVAMYFPYKGAAEFFDSYGNHPSVYNETFVKILNNNSSRWSYNRRCLQSLTSSTCGQFCLYYIMNRNRSKSMSKIVDSFSKDTSVNDHRVTVFVRRYLNRVKPGKRNQTVHQISLSFLQNRKRQ